tara:strand:+ start:1032 stop:3119 length:2088 start_codon:yes stop_codon:yes gene_type:complete
MSTTIHHLAYKISADTRKFTHGLSATKKELAEAKRMMRSTETPLDRFNRRQAEATRLLKKGALSVTQYRRTMSRLRAEYIRTIPYAEAVNTSMLSTLSRMRGMAMGVTAAVLPAIAVLRKAVVANKEFQESMAQSTAIMGKLSVQVTDKMSRAAKDVAFNTKFSSSEAAEAYYFLASAGLDAEQSMEALPVVAKFAQAGMFDLSLATDLLTDAQSAMGKSSENATLNMMNMRDAANALVAANTLGNASTQQFSEALTNKAGARLKLLNKDMIEGIAVLGAYADQSIKGEEAGTALDIALRELAIKSIKNKSAFQDMNVTIWDANEKMAHMADIVGDLEKALGDLSPRAKTKALMDLGFTAKSVAFIQMLIGNSAKIRENDEKLRSIGDVAEEVAEKNIPPLTKAIDQLSAAFDQLANSSAVSGALDSFAATASGVATAISEIERFSGVSSEAMNDDTRNAIRAGEKVSDVFNKFSPNRGITGIMKRVSLMGDVAGFLGNKSKSMRENSERRRQLGNEFIGELDAGRLPWQRAAPGEGRSAKAQLSQELADQSKEFNGGLMSGFKGAAKEGVDILTKGSRTSFAKGMGVAVLAAAEAGTNSLIKGTTELHRAAVRAAAPKGSQQFVGALNYGSVAATQAAARNERNIFGPDDGSERITKAVEDASAAEVMRLSDIVDAIKRLSESGVGVVTGPGEE